MEKTYGEEDPLSDYWSTVEASLTSQGDKRITYLLRLLGKREFRLKVHDYGVNGDPMYGKGLRAFDWEDLMLWKKDDLVNIGITDMTIKRTEWFNLSSKLDYHKVSLIELPYAALKSIHKHIVHRASWSDGPWPMQRLYFSMGCWDVWEYYGRTVQRSLYERQSDGGWHNGGMTESSVTAQYAAIPVGSDYRASKMHTVDEAYSQSSDPASRETMNECRKRTWSQPVIQVAKSQKVARLSATGEPLSPWAWVSPDTYRLLQVEVLTADFGPTEGPLVMEHTGMAGCLEAFRWPMQLEMYKYRLSSPWVGTHVSPDKGMSLASAPMATEQEFTEEINGMFGTNHTIGEYQFVGCFLRTP